MFRPARSCRAVAVLVLALLVSPPRGADASDIVSHDDGSTVIPVHRMPLIDGYGERITPAYQQSLPFSTRQTCGVCHDYAKISRGWHFNAGAGIVPAGRSGEPWVWLDQQTGMQIPLSSRGWEGSRTPESVGLTDWQFVKLFGRHMPGGDKGDPAGEDLDPDARWQVSGKLEINCLGCHSSAALQDHSEWVRQIERENLRWAATAASGLADVGGMAARIHATWDVFDGPNRDDQSYAVPPYVRYNLTQFDRKNRALFSIDGKPEDRRCLQCHAVARPGTEHVQAAGDIHSVAGLRCVNCHRNDLGHNMSRGYDGETELDGNPAVLDSSCRTCHLGSEQLSGAAALGGTHGAPKPEHKGLPPLHLEKLSCTVCHSGPWPAEEPVRIRTARANRLGIFGRARWYTDAPYIAEPVFVRGAHGVIEPHRMMWPAFWGRIDGTDVLPLSPAEVQAAGVGILDAEAQIVAILKALSPETAEEGVPVLASGGETYAIGVDDRLEKSAEGGSAVSSNGAAWALMTSNAVAALVEPFDADTFNPDENAEHWDIAERIGAVILRLANAAPEGAVPVFVNGGKIFARDPEGTVAVTAKQTTERVAWGWMKDGEVSPLVPPFTVRAVVATVGRDESMTEEQVSMVLATLAGAGEGEYAYICSGKLFKRRDDGSLAAADHRAAEPVSWPLGHDVRPASQSLGVKACKDCHAKDASFFFAQVTPHGPLVTQAASTRSMHDFMKLEGGFQRLFGFTFEFRPLFKLALLVLSGLIGLVLLFFALKVLERVLRFTAGGPRV